MAAFSGREGVVELRAFEEGTVVGPRIRYTIGDIFSKGEVPDKDKLLAMVNQTSLVRFRPTVKCCGLGFATIELDRGSTLEDRRGFEVLFEAALA